MIDIKLLAPLNGSTTEPLQRHPWRPNEEMPQKNSRDHNNPTSVFDQSDPEAFRYLGEPLLDGSPVTTEDGSLPRAVCFTWETQPYDKVPIAYDLLISHSPDFADSMILKNLSVPRAEVRHLHIATRYFWKVIAKRIGHAQAESETWSFTTSSVPPRWIRVPGTTNVRDMGGWPLPYDCMVRQGVLYRGSELNGHIQLTDEGKEVLVHELGIRTDLDLRGATEEAYPALDQTKVQWINIPVAPYHDMLQDAGKESLRKVFQVLAEASNYPILLHCWGGADRTGTLALLLHALLGVSEENLMHDYELTSLSIWGERSRSYWKFQKMLDIVAAPGAGRGQLADQVVAHLLSIGVSEEAIAAVRRQLVVKRRDNI